jgi:hypothetical protein
MRFSASSRARRVNRDRIAGSSWVRKATTIGRVITTRPTRASSLAGFREAQPRIDAQGALYTSAESGIDTLPVMVLGMEPPILRRHLGLRRLTRNR